MIGVWSACSQFFLVGRVSGRRRAMLSGLPICGGPWSLKLNFEGHTFFSTVETLHASRCFEAMKFVLLQEVVVMFVPGGETDASIFTLEGDMMHDLDSIKINPCDGSGSYCHRTNIAAYPTWFLPNLSLVPLSVLNVESSFVWHGDVCKCVNCGDSQTFYFYMLRRTAYAGTHLVKSFWWSSTGIPSPTCASIPRSLICFHKTRSTTASTSVDTATIWTRTGRR